LEGDIYGRDYLGCFKTKIIYQNRELLNLKKY